MSVDVWNVGDSSISFDSPKTETSEFSFPEKLCHEKWLGTSKNLKDYRSDIRYLNSLYRRPRNVCLNTYNAHTWLRIVLKHTTTGMRRKRVVNENTTFSLLRTAVLCKLFLHHEVVKWSLLCDGGRYSSGPCGIVVIFGYAWTDKLVQRHALSLVAVRARTRIPNNDIVRDISGDVSHILSMSCCCFCIR